MQEAVYLSKHDDNNNYQFDNYCYFKKFKQIYPKAIEGFVDIKDIAFPLEIESNKDDNYFKEVIPIKLKIKEGPLDVKICCSHHFKQFKKSDIYNRSCRELMLLPEKDLTVNQCLTIIISNIEFDMKSIECYIFCKPIDDTDKKSFTAYLNICESYKKYVRIECNYCVRCYNQIEDNKFHFNVIHLGYKDATTGEPQSNLKSTITHLRCTSCNMKRFPDTFYRCDNCKSTETIDNKFSKCSGCRRIYYCSIQCQKADWLIHKNECQIIRDSTTKLKSEE